MDWTAYVTALTLNRLGEREIDAMIDHVTGNRRLPESVRLDTIERTDGIPLAGEIALTSPERNVAEAETHFERALTVARAQQAKSRELRAATSMARLLRDQGRVAFVCDLLAPVYGWFTEGFDTQLEGGEGDGRGARSLAHSPVAQAR